MELGGESHAPATLPPRNRPGTIVQEAGWTPGPVWTDTEYLAPTGIRSPDSPARSESGVSRPIISLNVFSYFL
jgi:hypothetical protein